MLGLVEIDEDASTFEASLRFRIRQRWRIGEDQLHRSSESLCLRTPEVRDVRVVVCWDQSREASASTVENEDRRWKKEATFDRRGDPAGKRKVESSMLARQSVSSSSSESEVSPRRMNSNAVGHDTSMSSKITLRRRLSRAKSANQRPFRSIPRCTHV